MKKALYILVLLALFVAGCRASPSEGSPTGITGVSVDTGTGNGSVTGGEPTSRSEPTTGGEPTSWSEPINGTEEGAEAEAEKFAEAEAVGEADIAVEKFAEAEAEAEAEGDEDVEKEEPGMATLLYQGHGSVRITTAEGKVAYIDPYAGDGYDLPADLILVTHQHNDHNQLSLISSRNPGCETITEKEALDGGKLQSFDLGYATVEAVEAGNKNHDPTQCVGYIITLGDDGTQVYISGDTSRTAQMETFAQRHLDYAFLCCDGVYNMDTEEASQCAALIGARHTIPYHMAPGKLFDREIAEQLVAEGSLIVADGEEIPLAIHAAR